MMVDFPTIYLLAWGVRQPKIYRELEDQGKVNIRHIYIIYQKIYRGIPSNLQLTYH